MLENRNDVDHLWENYLISEGLKKYEYQKNSSNNYFWKTYDQKELDWVEEKSKKLFAYEFKWSTNKKIKIPIAFKKDFQYVNFEVI